MSQAAGIARRSIRRGAWPWTASRPPPPRLASPLLVDAFRAAGLDLGAFVRDHVAGGGLGWFGHAGPLSRERGEVVVVDASGRLTGLMVCRRGEGLEMRARLGPGVALSTGRGGGMLFIDGLLPQTLADALRGRPVSRLVGHPLLVDAYEITAIVSQRYFDKTVVSFSAPAVEIAPPR